jgi:hypothetical protein
MTTTQTISKLVLKLKPSLSTGGGYKFKKGTDYDEPEPFRERPASRREEADKFTILLQQKNNKYSWIAYRSADKEKKSKSRPNRGGVVFLWGDFFPNKKIKTPNYNLKFLVNRKSLMCSIKKYGTSYLRGTCLDQGSWIKILEIKQKFQEFESAITYTPDSNPSKRIVGTIDKSVNQKYIPSIDTFSFTISPSLIDNFSPDIICNYIYSFVELLKEEPRMKLKFDELKICGKTSECIPYLSRSVLQKMYNVDIPLDDNFEEKTKNGNLCRMLSFDGNDTTDIETERQFYFGEDNKELIKYIAIKKI